MARSIRRLAEACPALYIRRSPRTGRMDEARHKRIVFRAWRRGFREADLILGPFAEKHVQSLPEDQLCALERLLEEPDHDLYEWILGRSPAPAEHEGPVLEMIRSFQVAQALEGRHGG